MMRVYFRKIKKIKDIINYYAFNKKFGIYFIFLIATYILIIIVGLTFFFIFDEPFIIITCAFLPLIIKCIFIIYLNWKINDFKIISNIGELNKKIRKMKQHFTDKKKKVKF